MTDERTMMKIVSHNIYNLFSDTNVHVNSRYHIDYDKRKDRVEDMTMDITINLTVPEDNLYQIEKLLNDVKPVLSQLTKPQR